MQVSVNPASDKDQAHAHEQNIGVIGTRHSVVDTPPSARARGGEPTRYADSGADGYEPDAEPDEAPTLTDMEPVDSGIQILGPIATTEVPEDARAAPAAPQPVLNQTISRPPRPVGDVENKPGTFGTGYGGNMTVAATRGQPKRIRDLALDQRVRIWRWRVLVMVVAGVLVGLLLTSWPIGLTVAILAGIVHTVYRSRTVASIATGGNPSRAQRRTRQQLAKMRRAGYHTLHARPIPDSLELIDHLVVGPTGVYAIDSEKWHRELPIRTRNGRQLWHGPESKKERLEHARWEAQQASERLSAALGNEIVVRPAMAVYGPKVPWDIATIRDVDVFSGPRLRKYLRRRARMKEVPKLPPDTVKAIYEAAGTVLPGVGPTRPGAAPARPATPVG